LKKTIPRNDELARRELPMNERQTPSRLRLNPRLARSLKIERLSPSLPAVAGRTSNIALGIAFASERPKSSHVKREAGPERTIAVVVPLVALRVNPFRRNQERMPRKKKGSGTPGNAV
jgi:hypothetical protein